jgi:hypothetical protein
MKIYFRRILYIPLAFLYAFYLSIEPFLPWTFLRFIFTFGKNNFPLKKIFFIQNLVQSLFGAVRQVDPAKEIDDYCAYFDNQYGTRHPAFYRGRLSQVSLIVKKAD